MKKCAILLGLYAGALLACIGLMGALTLFVPIANWLMGALALWLIVCCGSLCIPDEGWDRLLGRKK